MPSKLLVETLNQYPDLASEPVRLVSYMLADFLQNMLADGGVDSGFGFDEGCLDFNMDGKPVRVIVKIPQPWCPEDAHEVVKT